ncbi:MAG: universal stress protein [Pseudomonadota bacterium]
MSLRTLLVPLCGAPTDSALLETAFGLARMSKAHAHAVFTRPDPQEVFVYKGTLPGAHAEEWETEVSKKIEATGKADAARSRRTFNKVLKSEGIDKEAPDVSRQEATGGWEQLVGDPWDIVPSFARFFDLTVFSRESKEHKLARNGLLVETLMHSGQPVLYYPELSHFKFPSHVLVAWNGSNAATRAIVAAIPILGLVDLVTIAVVGDEISSETEVSRLTDYLSAHSIEATSEFLPSLGKTTGKRILEFAHERECDLIVLGGFGHGRYREAIIGGTSRYLLNHADVPLLAMA